MLRACVRRFDVMGTIGKFLGTKQGLSANRDGLVRIMAAWPIFTCNQMARLDHARGG